MKYLIIGGAGFIGCNLADFLLLEKEEVIIVDNFSRRGTLENASWLKEKHPGIQMIQGDIRVDHETRLMEAMKKCDVVFHLAAQVAVTTSVKNPREDFEINALGTFNVLECVRKSPQKPILVYASTNKVYGGMEDIEIIDTGTRYQYKNIPEGISEQRPLDFHSPYGCSKGAADQYVHDYARIYGLKTIIFRQSCIYGTRQFGIEDQGWVAWFTIAATLGKPITVYGDGKQIRDILFIEDLSRAYFLAVQNVERTAGKIYNIGGGPRFTMSLLELIAHLEKLLKKTIPYQRSDWRPGDQRVYVSNVGKAKEDFGWFPTTSPQEGVKKLYDWVQGHEKMFEDL